jgi:hypothetical protein
MARFSPLKIASFVLAIVLVATLAWLTLPESSDPCATPNADVGAVVLADEAGDQDALARRAILVRANCGKNENESESESDQ